MESEEKMTKGILITIEGPDGAGKTTVLERLLPQLQDLGREVLATREPGGVAIAEDIRRIILDPANEAMDDKTELLLFIAARRQHLKERIATPLAEGTLVLVDRFIDSSLAYQGFGRGLSLEEIRWLNHYATDGLLPDLTLYFDIDAEEGLRRIAQGRKGDVDRMDQEAVDLHQRVRKGYLQLVAEEPERLVVIDASQEIDQVVAEAFEVIRRHVCAAHE